MISVILTINNRTPEVCRAVAASFRLDGNKPDEFVVVLDRPDQETKRGALEAYTRLSCPVKFVEIEGKPGWLGPARAWNRGFDAASGDLFFCISSEVVQDAGNVLKAEKIFEGGNTVVFGACHNSEKTQEVQGFEPGLIADSSFPRPLGFIACMPAKNVREIGGFDEEFMGTEEAPNYWYDDDCFYLNLWKTGIEFVFDDSIHGIHLHHERPVLATPEGQAGIARNRALMIKKHGKDHVWPDVERIESTDSQGRKVWGHVLGKGYRMSDFE